MSINQHTGIFTQLRLYCSRSKISTSVDSGKAVALILFDLFAAFDTIYRGPRWPSVRKFGI